MAENDGRDSQGKFLKGEWKGGPGNPQIRRLAAYKKALHETITEEDARAIFQNLATQARDGDLEATKVLIPYLLGRPKVQESDIKINLPKLQTTSDLLEANSSILASIAAGDVTLEEAAQLGAIVDLSRKTLELCEFEQRLIALEAQHARRN